MSTVTVTATLSDPNGGRSTRTARVTVTTEAATSLCGGSAHALSKNESSSVEKVFGSSSSCCRIGSCRLPTSLWSIR